MPALAIVAALVAVAWAWRQAASDADELLELEQGQSDLELDQDPDLWTLATATTMSTINRIAGSTASTMRVSRAGELAIQKHEALRLTRYRLGDGGWTIGWGRFFPDSGPPPPETITREQADAWFAEDIEARAARWVRAYVTAPLTQSQFDALASMAYNLSPRSFRTIAEAVNRGEDPEAYALRFIRAGTNLERGLRNRRAQELSLYRAEGVATA